MYNGPHLLVQNLQRPTHMNDQLTVTEVNPPASSSTGCCIDDGFTPTGQDQRWSLKR